MGRISIKSDRIIGFYSTNALPSFNFNMILMVDVMFLPIGRHWSLPKLVLWFIFYLAVPVSAAETFAKSLQTTSPRNKSNFYVLDWSIAITNHLPLPIISHYTITTRHFLKTLIRFQWVNLPALSTTQNHHLVHHQSILKGAVLISCPWVWVWTGRAKGRTQIEEHVCVFQSPRELVPAQLDPILNVFQ